MHGAGGGGGTKWDGGHVPMHTGPESSKQRLPIWKVLQCTEAKHRGERIRDQFGFGLSVKSAKLPNPQTNVSALLCGHITQAASSDLD